MVEKLTETQLKALDMLPTLLEKGFERTDAKAAEKEEMQKGAIKLYLNNETYEVFLAPYSTPRMRTKIGNLVKNAPTNKYEKAVNKAMAENPKMSNPEFYQFVKDQTDIDVQDMINYRQGLIYDEKFEKAIQTYYIEMFKIVVDPYRIPKEVKQYFDEPVADKKGNLNEFWQDQDFGGIKAKCNFFRVTHNS